MLYKADILAICPTAKLSIVDAIVNEGYKGAWERFGILTPVAMAKFMGQIVHESANLTRLEENLSYTAKRLTQVWPSRFPTLASAEPYARNPEKLANKVYGGRLGNVNAGDGWLYRGRGLKQTTGLYNYSEAGKLLNLDLVANPDLLLQPDIGFLAALAYWKQFVGNKGETASVKEITKIVNGGYNGLAERESATERADEIIDNSVHDREITTDQALDILELGRMKRRVLEIGNKGNDVRLLQAQLVELGYIISIDGIFGKNTANAIMRFQEKHDIATDGFYTSETREALQLELMEERLKADPTVANIPTPSPKPEAEPEVEAEAEAPVSSEALPDLPVNSTLILTADIVIRSHGDVMGVEEAILSSEDEEKIIKMKRLATVLWGQMKEIGECPETANALTHLETAILWAEKSVLKNTHKGV